MGGAMPKQFYTNKGIKYLFNSSIYEYDIERAGLQALYYIHEIDEKTYTSWKQQDKNWSSVYIGRNIPKVMHRQNECIADIVSEFIVVNHIGEDAILGTKRDAVVIHDTIPIITQIKGFNFIRKHRYSSYMHIDGYELYYDGYTDTITIKGTDMRYIRTNPLIVYIKQCMKQYELLEQGFKSYHDVYTFIHTLRNNYATYQLPIGCYREIANRNYYRLYDTRTGDIILSNTLDEFGGVYQLIVNYNFIKFIVPFIALLPSYAHTR
jgi:hypothetical protein